MPSTSDSTPTIKTSTSILISPKIIIVRISKYLHSPTTMTKMSLYTGATQHMIGDINMFLTLVMQSIFPSNQVIILADGIIVLPLCGVDTI